MAISYVSGAAAKANTVAAPSHQTGDIFVAFAFYNLVGTSPSAPSGWRQSSSGFTTNNGGRSAQVVSKVAASNSDTIPVFTGATNVVVQVYRCGAGEAWLPPLSRTNDGGSSNSISWSYGGNSNNYNKPGYTDGSWYIRFAAHATATNLVSAVSGWTSRAGTNANRIRGIDSNGNVSANANTIGTASYTVNQTNNCFTAVIRLAVLSTLSSFSPTLTIVSGAFDTSRPAGSRGYLYKLASGSVTEIATTDPTTPVPGAGIALNPDGSIFTGDYAGNSLVSADGSSVNAVGFTDLGFLGDGVASAENGASLYTTFTAYATPCTIYKMKAGVQSTISLTGTNGTPKGIKSLNDIIYVLVSDSVNPSSMAQVNTAGSVTTTTWTGITNTADEFAIQDNGTIYYFDILDYKIYSLISSTKTALTIKGLDSVYGMAIDQLTGDLYISGDYGGDSYLYYYSGGQQYKINNPLPQQAGASASYKQFKIELLASSKKTRFFSMF